MIDLIILIVLIMVVVAIGKAISKLIKTIAYILIPIIYITILSIMEYDALGTTKADKLVVFNLLLAIAAAISLEWKLKYLAPLVVLGFICAKIYLSINEIDTDTDFILRSKGFVSKETLISSLNSKIEKSWITEKNGMPLLDYVWSRYCSIADTTINNIIQNNTEKQNRIVLFSELPNATDYMRCFTPQKSYADYVHDDVMLENPNLGYEGFISKGAYSNMCNIVNQSVTSIIPQIDYKDTAQIIDMCGDPISNFFPVDAEWNNNNGIYYKCFLFDSIIEPFVQNGTIAEIPTVKEGAFKLYSAISPKGSPPNPMQPPNQEGGVISLADDEEEEE